MLLFFLDKTDLFNLSSGDLCVVHSVQLYVLNGPPLRANP